VAFAGHKSVQPRALQRMARFRIERIMASENPVRTNLEPLMEAFQPPGDYVTTFRLLLPNDDLSEFCGYLEAFQAQ
jgi:putative ATP-dependent endonuclease of OLD family